MKQSNLQTRDLWVSLKHSDKFCRVHSGTCTLAQKRSNAGNEHLHLLLPMLPGTPVESLPWHDELPVCLSRLLALHSNFAILFRLYILASVSCCPTVCLCVCVCVCVCVFVCVCVYGQCVCEYVVCVCICGECVQILVTRLNPPELIWFDLSQRFFVTFFVWKCLWQSPHFFARNKSAVALGNALCIINTSSAQYVLYVSFLGWSHSTFMAR